MYKKILTNIKGDIASNAVVEDFKSLLTSMVRLFRQKINKETLALNDTFFQMNLIRISDIHSDATENTLLSSAWDTFSKIDHTLGNKRVSINLRLKLYHASLTTTL